MGYDPEKYRDKREKVLGIKKKGIGFKTIATIVSLLIMAGLSISTLPRAVSYMAERHLDDAIFKLESGSFKTGLSLPEGIKKAVTDKNDTRLVVTYDRRTATPIDIASFFEQNDLKVTLLNEVNHRHHQATSKHEGE